jgi:hypothetical protein
MIVVDDMGGAMIVVAIITIAITAVVRWCPPFSTPQHHEGMRELIPPSHQLAVTTTETTINLKGSRRRSIDGCSC